MVLLWSAASAVCVRLSKEGNAGLFYSRHEEFKLQSTLRPWDCGAVVGFFSLYTHIALFKLGDSTSKLQGLELYIHI